MAPFKPGHVPVNKGKSKSLRWLIDHAGYDYDACLIWPFSKVRGYGGLQFNGRRTYAHRVMCEIVHGEPPSPRHQAAHTCGRGDDCCVHPQHLTWKLPVENQHDRRTHGTATKGWLTQTKLTFEQRQEVIDLALSSSATFDQIAARYGLTRRGVAYIVKNADKPGDRYRRRGTYSDLGRDGQ